MPCRPALVAAALLLAGGGIAGCSTAPSADAPAPSSVVAAGGDGPQRPVDRTLGPYPVTKVVDGDTIHVATPSGDVKVRMIGIDTPETVATDRPVGCFGPEASAEAERRLEGTSVWLEPDPTQGDVDKYGRSLDYVWQQDGRLFNLDMVAGGFAREYTYAAPYRYQAQFRAAQKRAIAGGSGMWSACR